MMNKFYKNIPPTLGAEAFENPPSEYRGAPFWAWNCRVTADIIDRQLRIFREMGFGGAHIHSRDGLDVPYLSDEFMSLVKHTVDESKKLGLRSYLYDEDRWSSGCAGGIVTKDRSLIMHYLEFTDIKPENPLAAFDIDERGGIMTSFRRISDAKEAQHKLFYAVVTDSPREGMHNGESYVNTLSKRAIDRFIEVTHERYKSVLGDDFGNAAPTIFTDEPEYGQTRRVGSPLGTPRMPWDSELPAKYRSLWNEELIESLPLLFFNTKSDTPTRWRYFRLICDLFAESYADNIGNWCDKNGILFAGHMMFEDTLTMQTTANGESMRHYRAFGIPGIDILFGAHEFTTAKQCQSVVHQYGKEGMLAELYGVTGWEADFRDYKYQGDWLAALGVTFRVPHLSWMSMKGESKRDYPASIFYQSCWYKEFKYLEDHFARLSMALTRGKPVVRIAVIHPVESCWLAFGPHSDSERLDELEKQFKALSEWLLFGSLDFDYLSESLMTDEYVSGKRFGEMEYDVIIVPPVFTLRSSTLGILEEYSKHGKLIFTCVPELVDALPSQRANELAIGRTVPFSKYRLMRELEEFREIRLLNPDGSQATDFICNYRDEGIRWLFIARAKPRTKRFLPPDRLTIEVNGEFSADIFDTLTGKISPLETQISNGTTRFGHDFYAHDSLLVRLSAPRNVTAPTMPKTVSEFPIRFPERFELDEPNVLLLDTAEFAVDPVDVLNADWQAEEEVLRISPKASKMAGVRQFNRFDLQPWARPETISHKLALRFRFESEIECGASIALENAGSSLLFLNGEQVNARPDGYFIDESIGIVRLPGIKRGMNELIALIPFGDRTKPEALYLLGSFGVRVRGSKRIGTEFPAEIGFSPLCEQELPFYTGTIDYICRFTSDGNTALRIPDFVGAAVRVFVDEKDAGLISFEPYRLVLDTTPGEHTLRLRLYLTRFDLLGALHNNDSEEYRIASFVWRQTGDKWIYGYRLRPCGILSEPIIELL